MTILIDAKHIGRALRHARSAIYCNNDDTMKLMNITESQLQDYETGRAVLSHDQLKQLFCMGLMMMCARQLQYEFCKTNAQRRKNDSCHNCTLNAAD